LFEQVNWAFMQIGEKERFPWAASVGMGAVIGIAGFALVFYLVAWFMPRFLHFTQSRWSNLLPAITGLVSVFTGTLLWQRRSSFDKRRSNR
jgi:cytochrome c biogenesis protein CcdA